MRPLLAALAARVEAWWARVLPPRPADVGVDEQCYDSPGCECAWCAADAVGPAAPGGGEGDVDPCPRGDPDCETGDDGSCHDSCEAPRA